MRQQAAGAVLVDIRPPDAFAEGHLKGALNVPFSTRGFAQRARTIAPAGRPIVLVGEDPQKLHDAAGQMAATGEPAAGTAAGSPKEWAATGASVEPLEQVSVRFLRGKLRDGKQQHTILDVREPMEWATGHVPGAVLISLGDLRARLGELDRDRPVIVICESGVRSSSAASMLQAEGFSRVANAAEGTAGYRRAGYEMQHTAE